MFKLGYIIKKHKNNSTNNYKVNMIQMIFNLKKLRDDNN